MNKNKGVISNCGGAAYAETVIMLPFFIILWAGIIYMASGHLNRINLLIHSRACAWSYAYGACKDSAKPPECTDMSFAEVGEDSSEKDGSSEIVQTIMQFVNKVVSSIFGTFSEVKGKKDFMRPVLLGGGKASVTANHFLMCNEEPRTLLEVITDVACTIPIFGDFMKEARKCD